MSSTRLLVLVGTAAVLILSSTMAAAAEPVRPSASRLSQAAAVQASQSPQRLPARARPTPPGVAAMPVLLGLGLVSVLAVAVGLGGSGASPE